MHYPTHPDPQGDDDDSNGAQISDLQQALDVWGLVPDRVDLAKPEVCYLWPCNVPTFRLWQRLQTQWRVGGMGSRTGLDYASVGAYLREVEGIKPRAFKATFSALQAMEFAALGVWAQERERG